MYILLEIIEDNPTTPKLFHSEVLANNTFNDFCEQNGVIEADADDLKLEHGPILPIRAAGDAAYAVYLWKLNT